MLDSRIVYDSKECRKANVYVEARPKGRPEGSRIDDYVVEDHADHVLATFPTQRDAIEWARKQGHSPLVARVRHYTLAMHSFESQTIRKSSTTE